MNNTESVSIQEFTDYLKFQKRYSQHTVISYLADLTDFCDFISLQYGADLCDISPAMVRSWLVHLKENKLVAKSINRKISSLKTFFKYHLKSGRIEVSPMAGIHSLKMNKRLPSYIEEKDMDTLFRYVEFPDNWAGKTERLLLEVFYQTGIRVSELVNLKGSQVDISNSNIKVLGKGNKERLLPVNRELLYKITTYMRLKSDIIEVDQEYLFVNPKGNKLYERYVYGVVNRYLSMVTSNQRKSPHILRHSFATHLTNNGADINAVKELLGHASLASTQIYTHNSIGKLKEIHRKAHPKSQG